MNDRVTKHKSAQLSFDQLDEPSQDQLVCYYVSKSGFSKSEAIQFLKELDSVAIDAAIDELERDGQSSLPLDRFAKQIHQNNDHHMQSIAKVASKYQPGSRFWQAAIRGSRLLHNYLGIDITTEVEHRAAYHTVTTSYSRLCDSVQATELLVADLHEDLEHLRYEEQDGRARMQRLANGYTLTKAESQHQTASGSPSSEHSLTLQRQEEQIESLDATLYHNIVEQDNIVADIGSLQTELRDARRKQAVIKRAIDEINRQTQNYRGRNNYRVPDQVFQIISEIEELTESKRLTNLDHAKESQLYKNRHAASATQKAVHSMLEERSVAVEAIIDEVRSGNYLAREGELS